MKLRHRLDYRKRRHLRLRRNIAGTPERPRMCVCVSDRHMYVQFVDDVAGRTLGAVSTLAQAKAVKNNVATAQQLGREAAEVARQKGIAQVVFDRGGNAYKGRVKAIAEAARAAGLKI